MASAVTSDIFPHLNPDTPMAFLPPDVAVAYTTGTYVMAAVVGAWFMDVFLSVPDEIRIYKKRRFKLPDLMYFLSRAVSGGLLLTRLILSVAPLQDCSRALKCALWFSEFATPINTALFLLRIYGVFHGSKIVIGIFSLLWLATFASFTGSLHVKAFPIGPTEYCIVESPFLTVSTSFIVPVIYDTLVFSAITWRIVADSPVEGWKAHTSLFFTGERIGHISRMLLQTGQGYYFVAVVTNAIAAVFSSVPLLPSALEPAIIVSTMALQNVIVCRAFRLLKLGSLKTIPDPFRSSGLPSNIVNMNLVTIEFNVPIDSVPERSPVVDVAVPVR